MSSRARGNRGDSLDALEDAVAYLEAAEIMVEKAKGCVAGADRSVAEELHRELDGLQEELDRVTAGVILAREEL